MVSKSIERQTMVNMDDKKSVILNQELFKIINFLKSKVLSYVISTDEPELLRRFGFKIADEGEVQVIWDCQSPAQIDISKEKIFILSSTLKFYDLFEVFEDKREDFIIYHFDDKIVCEVGFEWLKKRMKM